MDSINGHLEFSSCLSFVSICILFVFSVFVFLFPISIGACAQSQGTLYENLVMAITRSFEQQQKYNKSAMRKQWNAIDTSRLVKNDSKLLFLRALSFHNQIEDQCIAPFLSLSLWLNLFASC